MKSWTWDRVHILTDFDRTLTKGSSRTSWSLLMYSGLMPEEYSKKRMEYYYEYRPIEINFELPEDVRKEKMYEWWTKHLNLFIEFELRESIIQQIVRDPNLMSFRDGAKDFLKMCECRNIPLIIISAGVGNFIEEFFKYNNCLSENIIIVSNFINFKNGIATGFTKKLIHPLNKDEHDVPEHVKRLIEGRPCTLMLGDSIDDIKMILNDNRNKSLKIGFLEEEVERNMNMYKDNFDIVCIGDCSLNEVVKILNQHIR